MSKRFVKVASVDDVPVGTIASVNAEGEAIALCNVDGRFFAVRDECTHERFPLSAGELDDTSLTCTLHGARFDVETGEVLALPAMDAVRTYDVKVEGDAVLVGLDPE